MAIYCDKILGYVVDITEEFSKLDTETQDKWIEYSKELEEYYKKLNFTPYYSDITPSYDEMIIIRDSMSGKYTKLVIIIDYVYKSGSMEQDEDLVDSINRELEKLKINNIIKDRFEEAYNTIFNLPEDMRERIRIDYELRDKIKVQYMIHWH